MIGWLGSHAVSCLLSPRRFARVAARFAASGLYRSEMKLRWRKPPELFQLSNHTWPDRYPDLFRVAAESLADRPRVRLLSFGCSTGEEVFTLRRYFPAAEIKGIDINAHNISVCRRKHRRARDLKLSFELAGSLEREPSEFYDAVFCMAVFRHGSLADPDVLRCDHLIRFSQFEVILQDVERCLKPGGLIFVMHSNFRFKDSSVAPRFDLVRQVRVESTGNPTPIFDTGNRRTNDVNCGDAVFRKKGAIA